MATGDGLLVRVKPPAGRLTADAARLVAREAAAHGNGVIELTGRGSLQFRGLSSCSATSFAAACVAAGLACADKAAERRRSVIATPLAGVDPAASPTTGAVTDALETALAEATALRSLPAKFGFLVDGGGALPLLCSPRREGEPIIPADVRLRLLGHTCEVSIDGGAAAARVGAGEAVWAALALARAFLSLAGEHRRMRVLVAAAGEPAVFAAAGLRCGARTPLARGEAEPVGPIMAAGAFGAGLPFGSTTAGVLAALADLAGRFGDGELRLTPWRAVVLAGVERSRAEALRDAVAGLGLMVDPADPRLRVSACPGQPACASATVRTRALAAAVAGLEGMGTVHVSGCSKGCAHPGSAAVTLVGREGRFDLVRDGRAGDAPVRRGLSEAEAVLA